MSSTPAIDFHSDLAQDLFVPPVPQTVEETGLHETLIEQLLLKNLYFSGELLGRDLAGALGLKFSLIDNILEFLKRTRLADVKRSSGLGNVSAVFALSEAGRGRAKEYLDINQYAGFAPVPIAQYADAVREQSAPDGWLNKQTLGEAFSHMVFNEDVLARVGPAVNSGKSFLIYGQPGNGKTYLAEALSKLERPYIYVPHAIECQGVIIQMFDPIYHRLVDESCHTDGSVALEPVYDARWARCRRPFIVTGGELTLEMLDLSYNPSAKIYDAPFQLKANNGIYLIDDFGRQKVTPAELLNRWIIPMDRRVDYLTFHTGGKMVTPFETFLIFSTNLHPDRLGDEAFLRRIQYKMHLVGPTEAEFIEIFDQFCISQSIFCPPSMLRRFIDAHYTKTGKRFRRCHPRDVITHAIDLIRFESLPLELTDEVLDRAFDSCFLEAGDIKE